MDILLKDPADDSMYEVEVMLGETDETHIIRTIEYWDGERRRWPKRQHYAVLVAESITRRFYNVIQLFSYAIPIIAIQANIVEANGSRVLHFTKILDTYEEPDDGEDISSEIPNEEYWRKHSAWTLDAAKGLSSVVEPVFGRSDLTFRKHYICINVDGECYLWLAKRANNKCIVGIWLDESLMKDGEQLFDSASIPYVKTRDELRITTNLQMISEKADILREAATLVKKSWEE